MELGTIGIKNFSYVDAKRVVERILLGHGDLVSGAPGGCLLTFCDLNAHDSASAVEGSLMLLLADGSSKGSGGSECKGIYRKTFSPNLSTPLDGCPRKPLWLGLLPT